MISERDRRWLAIAGLVLGSFIVIHAVSGSSPALWLDMLNDQREARRCVFEHSCSLIGQAASLPGLFVAGGWLHVNALLVALRVSLDTFFVMLQALDALAVGVVALVGWRLHGPWLAALAGVIFAAEVTLPESMRSAIFNTAPLPFLGALLLLTCLAAVERPGIAASVVTALVAAVMANVHACCIPTGLTVVWVALSTRERRALRALVAGGVFALATFAIAPYAWLANARHVLHGPFRSQTHDVLTLPSHPLRALETIALQDYIATLCTAVAAAWLVSVALQWKSVRRALNVPMAIVVPSMMAYAIALALGVPSGGGKYVAHLKAAAALGVAVPVAAFGSIVVQSLPDVRDGAGGAGRASFWLDRIVPWLAALWIVLGLRRPPSGRNSIPVLTMADVGAIAHVLHDERRWTKARVRNHLRSPRRGILIEALFEAADFGPGDDARPGGDLGADGTDAVVLELSSAALPQPLPSNWYIARSTNTAATVIAFTPSVLDLSRSLLCGTVHGREQCIQVDEPSPDSTLDQGVMRLRAPIRSAELGTDQPAEIFMPGPGDDCAGHIVSVPFAAGRIDSNGRRAFIDASASGDVELEWPLYTSSCPDYLSRLELPFFIDTRVRDASLLERILRGLER